MRVVSLLYFSYSTVMRSHSDIITAAGGPARLARGLKVPSNRINQWKRLDSIPPRYWPAIAGRGLASLEELAAAAANRPRAKAKEQQHA